eukprot:838539-Prymnesium_polylepis.1
MHDAGSIGPTFATGRHSQGCRFPPCNAPMSQQKREKWTFTTRITGGVGGLPHSGPHPTTTLHHATA